MKLIIAIIQDEDSQILVEKLIKNKYRVTKLASTGGFLRRGNTTLLIGVEDEEVDKVVEIIGKLCKTRNITTRIESLRLADDAYMPYPFDIEIGGATIFILDVDKYYKL